MLNKTYLEPDLKEKNKSVENVEKKSVESLQK